jgi:hypothetical protein
MAEYVYVTPGALELVIRAGCDVTIREGDVGAVCVTTVGDGWTVGQDGTTVTITHEAKGGIVDSPITIIGSVNGGAGGVYQSVRATNGGVIRNVTQIARGGAGNVQRVDVTDSGTYINGVKVAGGVNGDSEPPRATVYVPAGNSLTAGIGGNGILEAPVAFHSALITVSGSASVRVGPVMRYLRVRSTSDAVVNVTSDGAQARLVANGSSSIVLIGDVVHIDAEASGAADIRTRGVCAQDYEAAVDGAASITHTGVIGGTLNKTIMNRAASITHRP